MSKFSNFLNSIKSFFIKVKDTVVKGYEWLGTDGIINMETSALLMVVFMLFFPIHWASILTFILVVGKCTFDKTRGQENEKHDFICAVIGILIGIIIGIAHAIIHIM